MRDVRSKVYLKVSRAKVPHETGQKVYFEVRRIVERDILPIEATVWYAIVDDMFRK